MLWKELSVSFQTHVWSMPPSSVSDKHYKPWGSHTHTHTHTHACLHIRQIHENVNHYKLSPFTLSFFSQNELPWLPSLSPRQRGSRRQERQRRSRRRKRRERGRGREGGSAQGPHLMERRDPASQDGRSGDNPIKLFFVAIVIVNKFDSRGQCYKTILR